MVKAGTQALGMAQTAAGQPFQMPVAPVAGFTPLQEQYFQGVQNMQGMAQPYFGAGANYLMGSAAPITGGDIANYYNPMAQNVTNQMQNIFGQQMRETTGKLTQQAGGVGADRIAVGQANLANQQGLAAGQTYAGLYQQALQAAEQQKQMMAGAGYGLAQMGPAAQMAQLQGLGALGTAGGQQQQLTQAQLNAVYQNQLARIAYPFQTAQYLAGITGGIGPSMGYQQYGTGATTVPGPTAGAQIAGVGLGALGLAGAANQAGLFSGFGSPMSLGSSGGTGDILGGLYREGGRINPFQSGGAADQQTTDQQDEESYIPGVEAADDKYLTPIPHIKMSGANAPKPMDLTPKVSQSTTSGGGKGSGVGTAMTAATTAMKILPMLMAARGGGVNPFDVGQSFDNGGPLVDDGTYDYQPTGDGIPSFTSPSTPASSPLSERIERWGGAKVAPDYASQSPFESTYPEPSQVTLPTATTVMPTARPMEASVSDPSASMPDIYRGSHEALNKRYGPQVASAIMGNLAVESPNLNPMESHDQGTGIGIAGWRLDRRNALFDFAKTQGRDPYDRRTQLDFLSHEIDTNPQYADMIKRMQSARSPAEAASIFRTEYERPAGTTQGNPLGLNKAAQLATNFNAGDFSDVGATSAAFAGYQGPMGGALANRDMTLESLRTPRDQLPYPDATQRDWGQRMARSPWLALAAAGAQMAQTRGPIGSVIGAGIGAGTKELEGQRKALQGEEEINLKADTLYQAAKRHLDQYQRMTPYEKATSEWRTARATGAGSAFEAKRTAWLGAHPGDEAGALEFASGRRQIPEPQLRRWAQDQALREHKDDPGIDINKRASELLQYYKFGQEVAPASTTQPNIGDKRVFKDNAGNDVTGVWDGTKWAPSES